MSLNQLPAEIEPQACPSDIVCMGIVGAHKATKNAVLLMSRNSYPMITHAKQRSLVLLIFTHRDVYNTSIRAVLDSVTNEIAEYLLDAARVRQDDHVLRCSIHSNSMVLSGHTETRNSALNQRNQVGRFAMQFKPPCL